MKAIIKTNDEESFYSLIQFLKAMHFNVETKDEKKVIHGSANKNDFRDAENFWNSISIDMSNFKFNREEAYER